MTDIVATLSHTITVVWMIKLWVALRLTLSRWPSSQGLAVLMNQPLAVVSQDSAASAITASAGASFAGAGASSASSLTPWRKKILWWQHLGRNDCKTFSHQGHLISSTGLWCAPIVYTNNDCRYIRPVLAHITTCFVWLLIFVSYPGYNTEMGTASINTARTELKLHANII